MEPEELKKIVSECIKMAKEAWFGNFEDEYHAGDMNREAVGRIANTLLEYRLISKKKD